MPSIQYGFDGEIISENYDDGTAEYTQGKGVTLTRGSIGDPNAPVDYSEEELAAALPFTNGANSPEQAELDGMRNRINFLQAKADKVAFYNSDGSPVYEVGAERRAELLRDVKNLTNGIELQHLMSQRSIARRYLDDQKKVADQQATLAHHEALAKRAQEIAFDTEAKELAALMIKRNLGGNRK